MASNIVFLDTETTGIDNGRLVQLAYKQRGGNDIFVEYYKPPVPIEIEAMVVHNISEKMVASKAPFKDSDSFTTLSTLLKSSVLVAHNAKFDIGILENEGVKTHDYICTLKVAQSMYDYPMYKLQYLRYRWGIDNDDAVAHDAKGDVIILEHVFEYMVKEYGATHNLSEDEVIAAFIDISKKPTLLKKISFGKYGGKTFEEIKNVDPGYLQWMASLQDKDEDFRYTVGYYLKDSSANSGKK